VSEYDREVSILRDRDPLDAVAPLGNKYIILATDSVVKYNT